MGTWQLMATLWTLEMSIGASGRVIFFCLTACPTWKQLSRRYGQATGRAPQVTWCLVRPWRPLKIRRTECHSRSVILITASCLQGKQALVDEYYRQEKSVKWIHNLGKKIDFKGWAQRSKSRTYRLSVDYSSCSSSKSGSSRAGRGTDW